MYGIGAYGSHNQDVYQTAQHESKSIGRLQSKFTMKNNQYMNKKRKSSLNNLNLGGAPLNYHSQMSNNININNISQNLHTNLYRTHEKTNQNGSTVNSSNPNPNMFKLPKLTAVNHSQHTIPLHSGKRNQSDVENELIQ
jgi:hypothetical protein|tara:strand:+ start:1220 stop:1636 length:417 start_codon:yes stop_codon:yes gene_type:complete